MTATRDKLRAMKACAPALQWIGNRTIEQAWRECEHGGWMGWLLRRIAPNPNDRRFRLVAADMAERVWDLIPDEPTRLAAAWAIGAARRWDADEMRAAAYAAYAAYTAAAYDAADAASAASAYTAAYATASAADAVADADAAEAAADAASAAEAATAEAASRADESAAQADILRQYFSAREVGELFRQAPA